MRCGYSKIEENEHKKLPRNIKVLIIVLSVVAVLVIGILIYNFCDATFSMPRIYLNGENQIKINVFEEYIELGAKATVNNKEINIDISSNLDTKMPGDYEIVYKAVNEKGRNEVNVTRKVIVEDKTAPVITLKGDNNVTIMQDDIYTDLGVNAIDNVDGDISSKVNIVNDVNTQIIGTYKVKYSISDSSGNLAEIERIVTVTEKPKVDLKKTIYLTFDDGPSNITEPLLNMLKKYNVKVTFFVVGVQIDKYRDVVRRASDEGHVIAVHCNTHVYSEVYKNDEMFFTQLEAARRKVKEITGKDTILFRFPGGSSNTIISLSHDSRGKTSTIEGTEMFINYCQKLGLGFDVITNNTPMITQKIAN